jgi:hypothetical protein
MLNSLRGIYLIDMTSREQIRGRLPSCSQREQAAPGDIIPSCLNRIIFELVRRRSEQLDGPARFIRLA